jgi:copper(I)-binding protein
VAGLPVAPGKPVMPAPGGYHIMLMGLMQALVAGTAFPVTLTFAKAGQAATTVTVQRSPRLCRWTMAKGIWRVCRACEAANSSSSR